MRGTQSPLEDLIAESAVTLPASLDLSEYNLDNGPYVYTKTQTRTHDYSHYHDENYSHKNKCHLLENSTVSPCLLFFFNCSFSNFQKDGEQYNLPSRLFEFSSFTLDQRSLLRGNQ